uniref:Nucleotide-diphospho-sugar transferase domain-containing protein n=1 Tax=viral metagenome TaxID=1070528 RepID=A0A6C0ERM7_9ZZZZ
MESINPTLFDIVIPIGPDDATVFLKQIEYTKRNIIGYRNIYLIIFDARIHVEGCITISESIFPFSKQDVVKYHGYTTRQGWYLQQLLKLYAGFVIPGILEKYLVIDADTFFLKPTKFIENGEYLFNISFDCHLPYFQHMKILHESFNRHYVNISGICHHMIFDTICLKQLFEMVEKQHNDVFWNIFLKSVDIADYEFSGSSEYEIYFNYMLNYHYYKMNLRKLKWKEVGSVQNTSEYEEEGYDYVTCHWYWR